MSERFLFRSTALRTPRYDIKLKLDRAARVMAGGSSGEVLPSC
jgi:hypothetical protein